MDNTVVVTPQYGTVVTDIGSAKLAAAAFEGRRVNITHAAVGDGGGAYYKPTTDQTALVNECWRGEIAWAKLNEATPNMYDVKFVVPADVGGFTIREAAIMDENGDVIAIWNTPAADKVAITEGVSFPLTMLSHIVFKDAGALEFKVNSALDTVSLEDLDEALERHNTDPTAHGNIRSRLTELEAQLKPGEGEGEPAFIPTAQKGEDGGVVGFKVIASRVRDPSKPTFGLGGTAEGEVSVALKTAPYTGQTELGVVVSDVLYDAENMSTHGDTAPDGTLMRKTEDHNNA